MRLMFTQMDLNRKRLSDQQTDGSPSCVTHKELKGAYYGHFNPYLL